MRNYLLLFALLLGVSAVWAQDSIPPPKTFWTDTKGEVKFGYSNFQGNTNKSNLVYGFKASKAWKINTLVINAGGTYGEVEGQRNQENYTAGIFDELKINKNFGGYAKYGFLKDEIAGYTAVHKIGAGALFTAVDKPTISLKARLGYEYRYEDRLSEDNIVAMNTGKAGFRLDFTLAKNIQIKTETNYQHDFQNSENYFADGEAKVIFNVNQNIDIEVEYGIDYRNSPPEKTEGTYYETTDTRFASTLKIKF